jgi:DHA1 family tetracycline resistance protein-like MFS transporter
VKSRTAAVNFVLVTVLLDVLAIGIIIPVQPKLVELFMGGDLARGAVVFGAMSTVWALMQVIFQPILGALSDRYGRRPVLLLSNLGLGLDYVFTALAPNIIWLFIARTLSGIAAATFSTATAYITDVTPPKERAAQFGKIGIAFGVGFVIGPALGGILGDISPRLPFWVAGALSVANAAYGYFILPESLAANDRTATMTLRSINPLKTMAILGRDKVLVRLSSALFLYHLAHTVLPALFVFYAGYRFGWGTREVGYTLAVVAVCSAIVQGGLIRPMIARFGARTTMLVGFAAGVAGFLAQAIVSTPFWYVVGIPIFTLWGFITPAAQQIMTQRVSAREQGALQGALGAVASVANLLGPLIFTSIFSWSISGGRDAAWAGRGFGLASMMLVAGLMIARQGAADVEAEPVTSEPTR